MAERFLKQIAFTDKDNIKWWGYTFPGFGTSEPTQKTSVIGSSKFSSRFDHSHRTGQLIETSDFLFMKNAERTKLATYPSNYSQVKKYVNEQVLGGTYKGAVNYVSELPSTSNDGDIYSVLIGNASAPAGDYRYHNNTQDPADIHPSGWYMVSSNRVPLATATYDGLLSSADFTWIQEVKNGFKGLIPVNSTVVTSLNGTTGTSVYAARADHLHDARYLRKDTTSAQSVAGPVTFTKTITIGSWTTSDIRDVNGNSFLGGDDSNQYIGRQLGTSYFRSGATNLIHRKNGADYIIWDQSLLSQTKANFIGHMQCYDEREVYSEYSSETIASAIGKPNTLKEKSLLSFFSMTNMPSSSWWSGIGLKGWTSNDYASWELVGPANTTIPDNHLYYRSGVGETWGTWKRIAFYDEVETVGSKYLPLTGGTMTGNITMGNNKIYFTSGENGLISNDNNTFLGFPTGTSMFMGNTGATDVSLRTSSYGVLYHEISNNVKYKIFDENNFKPLTIQLNGTTQGPFNGTEAKTINISPATIGASASDHTHAYLPLAGGTVTGLTKFNAGVQIGSTTDIGWFNSSGRISSGISEAQGVNVGSLLVSNIWSDASKVPTYGIYVRGIIHSATALKVQESRVTNLNFRGVGSMVEHTASFAGSVTSLPGTDPAGSGQTITDGFTKTYFWDSDFGFQLAYDVDGTGIAYRSYKPSTGSTTLGWKFLATTDWVASKVTNGTVASANKLTTPRAINGTNFDGTAAITTALWGTARTLTIGNTGKSVNGSANIAWSLAEIGAAAASHTHTLDQISNMNASWRTLNAAAPSAYVTRWPTFSEVTSKPISSYVNFGGDSTSITTAQFIQLLRDLGAFSNGWGSWRGSWYYVGNRIITDTGVGNIHLAGAWVEFSGAENNYTVRVTTPTTSINGTNKRVFIYVYNGDDYSPGWFSLARTDELTWNSIGGKPSTFTPSSHTHTKSQITDFPSTWAWSAISGIPTTASRWPAWGEVTGKPSTFTPSSHTHTKSQITDFPTSMPASDVYAWAKAASKPTYTYSEVGAAAASHSHSFITGSYTGSGGAQPPSYAETYRLKCNMMYANPSGNTTDGDTSYCDWIIMNAYGWNDVPYATAIGVSKKTSNPRAWIMCGPNSTDRSTWSRLELARKIDIPSSLKSPYSLTIQQNGTTLGTYDGSAAKTINITATSVTLTKASVMAALNTAGTNTFTQYCDFTAGAGNSGSDMRFKKDVLPIENILSDLMKINIFSYIWNKDGERNFNTIGVSADQLLENKLFAKLVNTRPDEFNTQFVDYDRIGVLALKGLQEANKKFEDENIKLNKEIKTLKTENQKIKNVLKLISEKVGVDISNLI